MGDVFDGGAIAVTTAADFPFVAGTQSIVLSGWAQRFLGWLRSSKLKADQVVDLKASDGSPTTTRTYPVLKAEPVPSRWKGIQQFLYDSVLRVVNAAANAFLGVQGFLNMGLLFGAYMFGGWDVVGVTLALIVFVAAFLNSFYASGQYDTSAPTLSDTIEKFKTAGMKVEELQPREQDVSEDVTKLGDGNGNETGPTPPKPQG